MPVNIVELNLQIGKEEIIRRSTITPRYPPEEHPVGIITPNAQADFFGRRNCTFKGQRPRLINDRITREGRELVINPILQKDELFTYSVVHPWRQKGNGGITIFSWEIRIPTEKVQVMLPPEFDNWRVSTLRGEGDIWQVESMDIQIGTNGNIYEINNPPTGSQIIFSSGKGIEGMILKRELSF